MRLVVLPGFTRGVEYHPIRVMRQFSFQQGAFIDSTAPRLLQPYPLNSTAATTELADLMQHGVQSTDIAATKGSGCTPEYVMEVQGLWPIKEIPPSAPCSLTPRDQRKPESARAFVQLPTCLVFLNHAVSFWPATSV